MREADAPGKRQLSTNCTSGRVYGWMGGHVFAPGNNRKKLDHPGFAWRLLAQSRLCRLVDVPGAAAKLGATDGVAALTRPGFFSMAEPRI